MRRHPRPTARALALLALLCLACASGASSITPQAAQGLVTRGAILLDVREAAELQGGLAAPARWLPSSRARDDDPAWRALLAELAKRPGAEVVVYCAAGGRAGRVGRALAEKGVRAYNMGGFGGWASAGLPVRKPAPTER